MAQNENKQMRKVSPRRMQHLIRGGAKIIEFDKFLGVQGDQMFRTIVICNDSRIFYTIQKKPFPYLIDANNSFFCATKEEGIQAVLYPS